MNYLQLEIENCELVIQQYNMTYIPMSTNINIHRYIYVLIYLDSSIFFFENKEVKKSKIQIYIHMISIY